MQKCDLLLELTTSENMAHDLQQTKIGLRLGKAADQNQKMQNSEVTEG